jgi:uncharacterized LabA/DUF88 family protein
MIEKYVRGKIAVFIDAANLENSAKNLKIKINYRKLRSLLKNTGELIYLGFYSVTFANSAHRTFLKSLKSRSYSVVTKPLKVITTKNLERGNIRKVNFDVEIAVDAMRLKGEFNTLILFSGDSDFEYLIKYLRSEKKTIIVISSKYHISKELIRSCNKYFDLKKLKDEISR